MKSHLCLPWLHLVTIPLPWACLTSECCLEWGLIPVTQSTCKTDAIPCFAYQVDSALRSCRIDKLLRSFFSYWRFLNILVFSIRSELGGSWALLSSSNICVLQLHAFFFKLSPRGNTCRLRIFYDTWCHVLKYSTDTVLLVFLVWQFCLGRLEVSKMGRI